MALYSMRAQPYAATGTLDLFENAGIVGADHVVDAEGMAEVFNTTHALEPTPKHHVAVMDLPTTLSWQCVIIFHCHFALAADLTLKHNL